MAIGRSIPPLTLDDGERDALEQWLRRPKTVQALPLQAKIVLSRAHGLANSVVGARVGVSKPTMGEWRSQFLVQQLDGLLDGLRSGQPRVVTDAGVERVSSLTLGPGCLDATHRNTRSVAQSPGLSHNAISRIWRSFGLQPHRTETSKLSADLLFFAQTGD